MVTALILPKNTLIPNSVDVLRVSSSGQETIVGSLNDNGSNGDQVAGDGIFSGTLAFSESTPGFLTLQVSAAFQGQLKRVLSPQVHVEVAPINTPIAPQPLNTLKVSLSPSGSAAICNQLWVTFSQTASSKAITSLIANVGAILVGRMPALGAYQLQFSQCDFSVLAAAQETLLSSAEVQSVSVDSLRTPTTSSYVPNDPLVLSEQWYLVNTQLPKAWGSIRSGATIGIIDTGVNYRHEDLAGQVILGKNWCQTLSDGVCTPGDDPAPNMSDHGTGVAGIAAAIADNHLGVAGAAFNAKIIAEQVYQPLPPPNFYAAPSTIAYAIVDAVSLGARVINLSLGSKDPAPLEQSAIGYALKHNVVVVASAGNDGLSSLEYPAAYPGVIAVGASDSNNQRAVWRTSLGGPCGQTDNPGSNYGSRVDVYAPGTYIVWLSATTNTGPGAYGVVCAGGTSAAAPLVAGTVALMLAANPALVPDQVKSIIKTTGQAYLDNSGNVIRDPAGYNITVLNAGAAVEAAAAASISFEFTGVVAYVFDSANALTGYVSAGNTVSGEFSYPTSGTFSELQYNFSGTPAGLVVTVNGSLFPLTFTNDFSASSLTVFALNDIGSAGDLTDLFQVSGAGSSSTWPPGIPVLTQAYLGITLIDDRPQPPTLLTSDALPTALDLSKSQDTYGRCCGNSFISAGTTAFGYTIQFKLTSLTRVQ